MSLRQGAVGALATLTSAARCYRRHLLVVLVLGGGASVQRALSVRYGDSWPPAVSTAGEVLTAVLRLALVVWVARALLRREPGLTAHAGARLAAFLRRDRPVLVGHLVLLTAAALVFNNLLEGAGALLPEPARPPYLAWLLAIKNVTVIPFTMIWLLVMVRDALRAGPGVPSQPVERTRVG